MKYTEVLGLALGFQTERDMIPWRDRLRRDFTKLAKRQAKMASPAHSLTVVFADYGEHILLVDAYTTSNLIHDPMDIVAVLRQLANTMEHANNQNMLRGVREE